MSRLLVSDTNIFIDLEEGNLLNEFFALPYEIAVPDILISSSSVRSRKMDAHRHQPVGHFQRTRELGGQRPAADQTLGVLDHRHVVPLIGC